VKEIITPPLTLKEASVTLYEDPGYGGQSLTLFPPTAATNVAGQRGDIRDFVDASPDGAPGDFNDKTSSATYLLPKGWSVVFFEDADYKAAQYKLVGTGKPEAIPDFSAVAPALDNKISSVRWVRE